MYDTKGVGTKVVGVCHRVGIRVVNTYTGGTWVVDTCRVGTWYLVNDT